MKVLLPLLFGLLLPLESCSKPEHEDPKQSQQSPLATAAVSFPEGQILVPLMDPAKLATLGDRGANPRIQKITAWLAAGKAEGRDPRPQVDYALEAIHWKNTEKGRLTREAILRNLSIAESLGCTDPDDIAAMKKGRAPIVERGPHKGEILSIDHVIPRAVVPELDNVLANLEFLPLTVNQAKGDAVGDRQRKLAAELHAAGLLSREGMQAVISGAR